MDGSQNSMTLGLVDGRTEDTHAFDELVRRRGRLVFRIAYAVTGRSQDAEDVVQEVFLRLFRTGAWKRMEDEAAFLARTTWRLAVAHKLRVVPLLFMESEEEEILSLRDERPSPEQQAASREREKLLHRLILQLPREFRIPLVLSAVEELPSGVIAEMLGIPAGTVRSRVLRARQMLQEKFQVVAGGHHGRT